MTDHDRSGPAQNGDTSTGPRKASEIQATAEEVAAYRAAETAKKAARSAKAKAAQDGGVLAPHRSAVIAAYRQGASLAKIGKTYGVIGRTVGAFLDRHVPPEIDGLPRIAGKAWNWLSDEAVEWAQDNEDRIFDIKDLANAAGWQAETATLILLALGVDAREALAVQTGGAAPTVRTATYRMMSMLALPKAVYEPLVNQTATARKIGVLRRDLWADPEPSTVTAPRVWTLANALRWAFDDIGRPSDRLARTGHVFAVVTETRGAAVPLTGAIEQRIGFEIPVWPCGGQASLPRRLHIETEMLAWAKRTGCEPHLLTITDYDPSGAIIGDAVAQEVRGVDVQRIGMWPDQAPTGLAAGVALEKETTHSKSEIWEEYVEEHGDDTFQAEAVDYAGWAEHVQDAIEEHIDLDEAEDEHGDEWDEGDALMAALRDALDDNDGDPAKMREALGL